MRRLRTLRAVCPLSRACTPGWSTPRRGPAAPGRPGRRRRRPAGASRTNAEHVRRDLGQARLGGRRAQRAPRSLPGQPARRGRSGRRPGTAARSCSGRERGPGLHQVGVERPAGVAADRHDPLLVPLAGQPNCRDLIAGTALAGQVNDRPRPGRGPRRSWRRSRRAALAVPGPAAGRASHPRSAAAWRRRARRSRAAAAAAAEEAARTWPDRIR